MSNIEQNLEKILSSRYGRDVRQSIHDSIRDCYEDGKAGAVDLVARERIDNLVANEGSTDKDSELVDVRVGADGTTYESAGKAVREQIGLLSEDIGQIVNKRTYQLYDKKNKYGNLYRKSDGEIIINDNSISFTFLIENNNRKVFRIDNIANLVGKITAMGSFASVDYPAPGIQSMLCGSARDDSSIYGGFSGLSNQKYGTIYLLFPDSSEEEIQEYAKDISNKLIVGDVTDGFELEYENYRILNVEEKNLPDNFRQSIIDEVKNYSKNNYWKDKTIIWFGTSIPEGRDTAIGSSGMGKSYPEMVGDLLGASIINMSLGSSMARANTRTGDYEDGYSYNIVRTLTATIEEKQDMITNWETYRQRLRDPDTYESLEGMEDIIINSSFENRLLPYLDGTHDMPDLFVIDHGHNDHKYKLQDGSTDILLNPTPDNIENGTLSEDTFMTKNSNKNMINFFGDLSKIPNINSFIASINRNCFKGAINFICTLILKHNPRARIIFISNLDNWQRTDLTTAQKEISESWSFPIIEVWKYLGFGVHYIPGTSNFWGNNNPLDLTQKQIYCKDGTHPHSDTTGKSMEMYANIIANGLKNAL